MEISRNSWHYRLYRYICNVPKGPRYLNPFASIERFDTAPPRSLCPYFWSICLGLLGAVFVGTCFLIVSPVIAFVVAVFWVATRVWRALKFADKAIMGRLPARKVRAHEAKKNREKNPSLVVAFAKASKNRVCPTIKLVD